MHEIPRDAITKAELANALGTHQFHIHFPGAGLMGHVNVFINQDQIQEAEKMIEMIKGIETTKKDTTPIPSNISNASEHSNATPAQEERIEVPQSNTMDGDVLLTAEGTNGKVELLERTVRIYESSKPGKDTVKEVSIKEIKKVNLKKKGLTDGNISLNFPGSGPFGMKIINFNEDHTQEFEQLTNELICRINPQSADSWYNKGVALGKQGKYDEAIKAYDEAIRIDSNYAKVRYNKGNAHYSMDKYDEAIEAYDKAIEIDSQYAAAWNNKGMALYKQDKYDEALKVVERAIELDPKLATAQNARNLIQKKLGIFKDEKITKRPEAINKNIAKILERRGLSSSDVLIAAEGANGQICLTDKGVIIGREGLGNKILEGFTKGEKFLPYRNIAGVQFKEPGITWGYIQFTLPGGIESRGGSWDAGSDENTITFNRNVLESFRKIRSIVEERQDLEPYQRHQHYRHLLDRALQTNLQNLLPLNAMVLSPKRSMPN